VARTNRRDTAERDVPFAECSISAPTGSNPRRYRRHDDFASIRSIPMPSSRSVDENNS
jgi:hypothetical protein